MFYAILNFTLSGAIAVVGLMTLRKVSTPKEVVFASLPLLFALHQFTEGFVWLGVNNLIEPRALYLAEGIFVFYAQGLLQFLVPLAMWLLQPKGIRKTLIFILMVIGGFLTVYTIWGLSMYPTSVTMQDGFLSYSNPWTNNRLVGITYILTTCGSLMLNSSISIQIFGWLNFIGLAIIYSFRPYAVTAGWCFYAAIISVLLYFYFVEQRIIFLQKIRRKEDGLNAILEKELASLKKWRPGFSKNFYNILRD